MTSLALEVLAQLDMQLDLFDECPLGASEIVELGLLPPLPVVGNILIWGHHLLRAAAVAGKKDLSCLTLSDMEGARPLRIALLLENRTGKYSWPERERISRYLDQAEPGDDFGEIALLVEGRPDAAWQTKIRQYRTLDDSLKVMVARGILDLKTARKASSLPACVLDVLLHKGGQLSFSARRILLEMFQEIVERDHLTDVAAASLLDSFLSQANPLEQVKSLRYKELCQLERRFSTIADSLKGSGVTLKPPPFFEGETFSVTFDFSSSSNLEARILALKRLIGKVDELLELL